MISNDTVEQIRHRTRLAKLIGERVKLERRGTSYVGLCPFHKEKTPSFHVNDERGFYYCFGCQARGDAITFIRETEGVSFIDAVRELGERVGIEVEDNQSAREKSEQDSARKRTDEFYRANELAAQYFERCLEEHPLAHYALSELESRGLAPEADHEGLVTQTLSAFRVGYAPHGWDGLANHLRQTDVAVQAAEAVGLLAARKQGPGFYDRFRHRLMFAVVDLRGRVVAFSGRALSPVEVTEEAEKPAKYINSPESPIYRKREHVFGLYQARQAARAEDRCVLVEGNFDVMSLHARGIPNVVAPLGTAFTVEQAQLIKRFSSNVVVLFDGDAAGRKATRAAREPCQEAGIRARVCQLPDGVDPDELVRLRGPTAIRSIVDGSRGMLEYLIETTLEAAASGDSQSLGQKLNEVAELIKSEEDPAARSMAQTHADAIQAKFGITDARTARAVHAKVRAASAPRQEPARAAPPERARSPHEPEHLVASTIAPLLEFPELLDDAEINGSFSEAEGDLALSLAAIVQCRSRGLVELTEICDRLPARISPLVWQRLVQKEHATARAARSTVLDNFSRVRRQTAKTQTVSAQDELERARAAGNFDEEMRILGELQAAKKRRDGIGN